MSIFLFHNIFIQIRSLLTVFTSYYDSKHFVWITLLSGTFHSVSIYNVVLNIIQLLCDNSLQQTQFENINNIITIGPISFDIICIFMNSNNNISIPFLLVNIIIGLLLTINPFYKLNHVGFHILLLFQNYYLSLSHSGV